MSAMPESGPTVLHSITSARVQQSPGGIERSSAGAAAGGEKHVGHPGPKTSDCFDEIAPSYCRPRLRTRHDYSRELRPTKWGQKSILQCENPWPLMSAVGAGNRFWTSCGGLCPTFSNKWRSKGPVKKSWCPSEVWICPKATRFRGRFETRCYARSSSSRALASFRLSVAKPSVNQP
jgi:hypothetical protein